MKIVFLLSRFPFPLEKGDKLRAYQHLKNLRESGHEVYVIALSDEKVSLHSINKIKPLCASLHIIRLHYFNILINLVGAIFRRLPLQVGYFYSGKNQNKIDELLKEIKPDVVYCQLIRMASYVKNYHAAGRVIDYQDTFSRGTWQRLQLAPFFLKPIFKREFNLVKEFEEKSYNWFNVRLIISEQDKETFPVKQNSLIILPNGVDTSYFYPDDAPKKVDVTFVGNMNYPPNVDGACFLVNEIMPLVWKEIPGATIQIAGANPHKRVRALASANVFVTGWVEDIRHAYHSTKVFVAPMRIGIGLQNKLLEAMAMKIPCVTTPLSFEPLGAILNQDILVGTDAGEIASCIIRLLQQEYLRLDVAEKGMNFVTSKFAIEQTRISLNQAMETTRVSDFK